MELLKAFVLAYNPTFETSNLPNKGNIAYVLRGVDNLIWLTFDGRTMHTYKRNQRQADRENDDVIVEYVVKSLTVYKV